MLIRINNRGTDVVATTITTASCVLCITVMLFFTGFSNSDAQKRPEVRIVSVRRIFHNGEHNAFTDMCRFNGKFFLTFRSCPDGHGVYPTASIIVLSSDDAEKWEQVHRFNVPERDTRDPHFLIFKGKLFVYTGTWFCGGGTQSQSGRDMNRHLGYACRTQDGREWTGPELLEGTYGHYIWRAATYEGKAYLCGRRKHDFTEQSHSNNRGIIESAMLESEDGIVWKTRALFQEQYGDETAFLFESNGSVLAVSRRGGNEAQVCRAFPPYTKWQRNDLDRYIGGPLLVKWGSRYVVGGRQKVRETYKTSLYWLENDNLFKSAELISGGDNSYPGFVEMSAKRALVSYYSSHEKDENGNTITAIYLAELELTE